MKYGGLNMGKANVRITFSGDIEIVLDDTRGMLDEEIEERAMEELAQNLDLLANAAVYKFEINKINKDK